MFDRLAISAIRGNACPADRGVHFTLWLDALKAANA